MFSLRVCYVAIHHYVLVKIQKSDVNAYVVNIQEINSILHLCPLPLSWIGQEH